MKSVRIPTGFDFTSYTNLVQLELASTDIVAENYTIRLSYHPKLKHLSLRGDLLETQSNEFRVVLENLIFEDVIVDK